MRRRRADGHLPQLPGAAVGAGVLGDEVLRRLPAPYSPADTRDAAQSHRRRHVAVRAARVRRGGTRAERVERPRGALRVVGAAVLPGGGAELDEPADAAEQDVRHRRAVGVHRHGDRQRVSRRRLRIYL